MKTIDKKRVFKLHFEKSNLSFGVMVPISDEPEKIESQLPGEPPKQITDLEFVNFSSIKGMIVEEKNFAVQDNFHRTGILSSQVNIDRLPRLAFNLRQESESGNVLMLTPSGAQNEARRPGAQARTIRTVHGLPRDELRRDQQRSGPATRKPGFSFSPSQGFL